VSLKHEQRTSVGLVEQLRPTVEKRQALIAERDRILQEIAGLSDEIAREMAIADEKSVRVGPYALTLVENPGRLSLDKHRLVELGVSPETITAATVRGNPSITLHVRTASEE
jgi:hypothetical protein